MIRVVAPLALLALAAGTSAAQVRGSVRDSTSGLPVPGAVVLALDTRGDQIARSITTDRGEFTLRVSQPPKRLQVLRIGFRPRVVEITNAESRLDITMVAIPTLLQPISVFDQPNCPRRDDSPAAFALWEQAKSALLASVVAREVNPAQVVRLHFDRRIDRDTDTTDRLEVRIDSTTTTKPFTASRPAGAFIGSGFMDDSAKYRVFHAPDAEVLLDAEFPRGYCFEIAPTDRTRPREIGLGFRVARRRAGRVDIAGTVWIDTAARALTDIVYRYVGLDARFDRAAAGGRVSFRTMRNGTALIDRWHIRLLAGLPGAQVVPAARLAGGLPGGNVGSATIGRNDDFEIHEKGGEVAGARWPDGQTWTASLGTLRGRAWYGSRPAAGLRLQLFDTDYFTVTDSTGAFNIPDLLPGPYALGVVDPILQSLGMTLRTGVVFSAVRDSVIQVSLAAPQAKDYVAAACESMRQGAAGEFSIVGRVFNADGTAARAALYDVRMFRGLDFEPFVNGRTDENGLFVICSVDGNERLQLSAHRQESRASVVYTVRDRVGTIRLTLQSPDRERHE